MIRKRTSIRGFTLVELLVVIGIIAILVGILIPVVNKVRIGGYVADSKNFISQLQGAIERYHGDFGAYPGPVSNNEVWRNDLPTNTPDTRIYVMNDDGMTEISPPLGSPGYSPTMEENLVLGLVGGLFYDPATQHYRFSMQRVLNAQGPTALNTAGTPKQYAAYVPDAQKSLFVTADSGPSPAPTRPAGLAQWGKYFDGSGFANDTAIPEFVDRFTSPMPILYGRAKVGSKQVAASAVANNYNSIVTDNSLSPPAPEFRAGQYDVSQVLPYTGPDANMHYIGESKTIKGGYYIPNGGGNPPNPPGPVGSHGLRTVNVTKVLSQDPATTGAQYPYDAYPYFTNPAIPNTPRAKDGFILICAGADRVYGTNDDITTFGDVAP